jgi:predicted translation initiation factor SUI1
MKLKSLEDLAQLLPESERHAPKQPAGPTGAGGHDGKGKTVHLRIERKGRKGKTVTIVSGLRHNPDTIQEIAQALKNRCGTGGTVKEGNIELQGDMRDRAGAELQKMNYVVR